MRLGKGTPCSVTQELETKSSSSPQPAGPRHRAGRRHPLPTPGSSLGFISPKSGNQILESRGRRWKGLHMA